MDLKGKSQYLLALNWALQFCAQRILSANHNYFSVGSWMMVWVCTTYWGDHQSDRNRPNNFIYLPNGFSTTRNNEGGTALVLLASWRPYLGQPHCCLWLLWMPYTDVGWQPVYTAIIVLKHAAAATQLPELSFLYYNFQNSILATHYPYANYG